MFERRATAEVISSHSEAEMCNEVGGIAAVSQAAAHRKNAMDFHRHSSGTYSRSRSTSPHDLATLEADARFKPPPPFTSTALPQYHSHDDNLDGDVIQHVRRIPFKTGPAGELPTSIVASSSTASCRPSTSPTRRTTNSTSISPSGSVKYQEVRSITRSMSPPLAPAIPIIRRGHFVTMLHKGAEEWECEQRFLRKDSSKDNDHSDSLLAAAGDQHSTERKSEGAFCRTDGEVVRPDKSTAAWDNPAIAHTTGNSGNDHAASDKGESCTRIPTPTSTCESFAQQCSSVVSTTSRLKATGFITVPLAQRISEKPQHKTNIQELLRDPRGRLGTDGKGMAALKSQPSQPVVAQHSTASTLTSRSTSASKYGSGSSSTQPRTASKSPMRLSPNNFAQGLRQSIPSKSPVRNGATRPFAPTGGSLAPPPLISMRSVATDRTAAGAKKKDSNLDHPVPGLRCQPSSSKGESLEKALHDYQETMERLVESYQRGRSVVKVTSIPAL